ncbi:hypothetical protein HUW63_31075 [Myxococcus sp. AM001]|nr:hypothetical protein [Myxococcus sp. AM001]
MGVLLVAGWAACTSRTREAAGGASESSRQQAQEDDGLPRLQQTDGGCAVDPCLNGGPGCLDLVVETGIAGKRFDPRPGVRGWKLCSGQGLEVTSDLAKDLCIDLRDVRSVADGGVVALTKLRSKGSWSNPDLPSGEYCLSICDDKGHQCSEGCKDSDCVTDDQTIRGNLDVVTKVPEPDPDRE